MIQIILLHSAILVGVYCFGRCVRLSICLSVRIFLSSLAFELLHKRSLYFFTYLGSAWRDTTYRVLGDRLAACRSRASILLRTYLPTRIPYTHRSIRALNQGQHVISRLLYRHVPRLYVVGRLAVVRVWVQALHWYSMVGILVSSLVPRPTLAPHRSLTVSARGE